MAPIRVGIVGLRPRPSGDLTPSNQPGYWASVAHLPALRAIPEHYEIVAVCNSSTESANEAIKQFDLPESTKAYGSVEDLANDSSVDLVVVCVGVGKHFKLAKLALEKKKQVFVEWPLGAGLSESEELSRLAVTAGVRTSVGVQGRADPLTRKLKSIVESGQIGKVLSSSVLASSSILPFDTWEEGSEYYLDQTSGGNNFFIVFAHFLDSFTHVLGGFTDVQAILKSSVASVAIFNSKGDLVNPAYPKTSPDQIAVQGILENDAVVSIACRKSKTDVDGINFRWIISGTEGEIEVIVPGSFWQFAEPTRTLRLKIGNQEAQNVDFLLNDDTEVKVPTIAANILRQYVAFAKDDTEALASFESALKTHKLLDRILRAAGWESV